MKRSLYNSPQKLWVYQKTILGIPKSFHVLPKMVSIILLFILFQDVSAQEQTQLSDGPDYFIEGGLRYGTALHHPESFDCLKDFWFNSYEVRLGIQAHGKNDWERPLGNPVLGIALRYTDYSDFSDPPHLRRLQRDTLGKNIAVFGYMQAPIVRWGCFTWHYQLGLGAACFTKTNELISVHVNPYVSLQSGFDFRLSRRVDLSVNANFVHASNASLNFPNWGINEIQGIVGMRYHFNNSENPGIKRPALLEKFKPHNALFVTIDPGWLWARYNNWYYLKTGISAGYERQLIPFLKVGTALEFHVTNRLTQTREYKPVYDDGMSYEAPETLFSSAALAFVDLTFGRFAFSTGVGAYIFRAPSGFDLAQAGAYSGTLAKMPWFYEKIGLKVSLGEKQNHFVGASIRAHFPVADYLAFTYGYRFWKF